MIIKFIDVCKSFGDTFKISNLNFEITDKSFTTFLGPSGCGKTTVLRLIAGLEKPDSGEVWFDNICVFSSKNNIEIPTEKRNLGFVFQDFALWPHMTVFENVAFGLRARKENKGIEKKVKDALDSVQLWDYKDRFPEQLSGGQQQRVGFARAIVTNPSCILFDEPMSALDAILRDEMRAEIKRLTKLLGVTSVFVTHDQMEAMSMSDEIFVFNKGHIEQKGKPEEIYQKPNTEFVAKFIGKSNWITEKEMFRPEGATLKQDENKITYKAKVDDIQFLGNGYRLVLNVGNEKWTMKSSEKHFIGEEVSVYLDKKNIVGF